MPQYAKPAPVGTMFGRMTVIGHEVIEKSNLQRQALWRLRCECGTERTAWPANVRNGKANACADCGPTILGQHGQRGITRNFNIEAGAERANKRKARAVAPGKIGGICARVASSIFDLGRTL